MKKIAIFGAGISGLFFANLLKNSSEYDFTIFEKRALLDIENGYGIQLSVNSIKLLNEIGFNNVDKKEIYNPKKINFINAKNNEEICDLDISKFNYDDKLSTGAIAAGGTIGILIPPSVILVLYGILTESNIGDLFLAGFIPGILTIVFFMGTISILTRIYPNMGPRGDKTTPMKKLLAVKDVWGTIILFLLVIGGIYLGIFSPEEAAGIGASGALVLSLIARTMTWKLFFDCLMETVRTSAMIFTILIGAILLNNFLILSAVPDAIGDWIGGLAYSSTSILIIILVVYLVMGCALDSLAMILLTIPIFFPVIQKLGFDPIWFGIIVVMVVELGLITPPVGMNVFIIKGMAADVPLGKIYRGVLPFVIAQIMLIAIIVAFPEIATWLPSTAADIQATFK